MSNRTIFIKKVGDELFEGERPFRFFALAAANLHQNEDELAEDLSNRFPDEFEIRDSLTSLQQMGGTVTRTFSLSITSRDDNLPVYIEGLGKYNETAFVTLDLVMKIANELGIRIILPFIDSHSFPGWRGVFEFAGFRNKSGDEFWTDDQLKADFKELIRYVINRTNSLTGVKYRDDPAILAWQFGNELDSYIYDNNRHLNTAGEKDLIKENEWQNRIALWSIEMAAFIKEQDPNHLVMEAGGDRHLILSDPNIDIASEHYYAYWNEKAGRSTDLAALNRQTRKLTKKYQKALIADEFGMSETKNLLQLMDEIITNGTSGGLLWGLRPHKRDGGFYRHNESGTKFSSYHWTGYPSGEVMEEAKMLELLRDKAFTIRNLTVPPMPQPTPAPQFITTCAGDIFWRGSTGASAYILEKSLTPNGPWSVVNSNLTDDGGIEVIREFNLFDREAHTTYFRLKAINKDRESQPSQPVKVERRQ